MMNAYNAKIFGSFIGDVRITEGSISIKSDYIDNTDLKYDMTIYTKLIIDTNFETLVSMTNAWVASSSRPSGWAEIPKELRYRVGMNVIYRISIYGEVTFKTLTLVTSL